ncbi:MAG TPA: ABC transporter permease [Dehalococcoidia bacterium]|nr:ABC transporter permease [Dehalococcoidia bacterium]
MAGWTQEYSTNKDWANKVLRKVHETVDTPVTVRKERRKQSWLVDFLVRLVREKPLGLVGAVITLLLFLAGIFADVIMPYPFAEMHLRDAFQAPSGQHIMGTDDLGRDLFSRVVYGARISMIVGLGGATLGTILSTILGIVSGYYGGKTDLFLQRFVDSWMSFPGLFLMLSMITIIGQGMWQLIIVIGLLYGIGGSRIVRSAVIGIKENAYVQAAVATGCPPSRMLLKHILPNVMAPIIILFTTRLPSMILLESTLSFLGYGIPPPTPSWGGLLGQSGRDNMLIAPWLAIWPGVAISMAVYGVNIFGDAIRDLLDPRLRGGLGRYSGAKPKISRARRRAGISSDNDR